jgi:hypothetical protein
MKTCSQCKNEEIERDIPRELFEMVYQWGRVGVVVDEHCPAFKDLITTFENSIRELSSL